MREMLEQNAAHITALTMIEVSAQRICRLQAGALLKYAI